MSAHTSVSALPWYRERWPWLLMAGPAIVVVAGLFTAWLAVTHEDGLVADDYYKQGLAINQEIRRDAAAGAVNLHARLMFGGGAVRVFLSGSATTSGTLVLRLVHPTRAKLDQKIPLTANPGGWYEGKLDAISGSRWGVVLEDEARTWRLTGELAAVNDGNLELAAGRRDSQEGKP
jgi:uncharacterized protein